MLMVRRSHTWYLWNVLLYLWVAVWLSWSAFLLPSSSTGALDTRAELSVTMVIAVLAIRFCCVKDVPLGTLRATLLERCSAANCGFVTVGAIASIGNRVFGAHARLADGIAVAVLGAWWMCYHGTLLLELRSHAEKRRKWADLSLSKGADASSAPKSGKQRAMGKQFMSINGRRFILASNVSAAGPEVQVGYTIESISDINLATSVYSCSFELCATWVDPRLIGCSEEQAKALGFRVSTEDVVSARDRVVDWEGQGLYQPDLHIVNGREMSIKSFEMAVADRAKGAVCWKQRISGSLHFEISKSLRFFPFDYHELRICVRSHKMNQSKANLVLWTKHTHVRAAALSDDGDGDGGNEAGVGGWRLVGHRADVLQTDKGTSSTGKVYSEFHAVVMVQRRPHEYLLQILLFLLASFYTYGLGLHTFNAEQRLRGEWALVFCALIAYRHRIVALPPSSSTLSLNTYLNCLWALSAALIVAGRAIAWHAQAFRVNQQAEGEQHEAAAGASVELVGRKVRAAQLVGALVALVVLHIGLGSAGAAHLRARAGWRATRIR